MRLYPAIDVLDGRVVRLVQGDYGKVKHFQPIEEVTSRYVDAGVDAVHMVDLSGAKDPSDSSNREMMLEVIGTRLAGKAFVQFGGGIRNLDDAERILAAGVDRVVVGTLALVDHSAVSRFAAHHPGRIAVALDFKTKNGVNLVAVRGWTHTTDVELDQAVETQLGLGIHTFLVTDVGRDGMGTGPNFEVYSRLVENYPIDLICSGGVASMSDLSELKSMEKGSVGRIEGVVVGTALYEGKIDLEGGLALCSR